MTVNIVFCDLKETERNEKISTNTIQSKMGYEVEFDEIESHNRNSHLLHLLSKEPNSEITFQGLKRKLGWHQERHRSAPG